MPRHDIKGTICQKQKEIFWVTIEEMEKAFKRGCEICFNPSCQMEIDYSDWGSCGIQVNLANPIVYYTNRQGHIIPATDVNEPAPVGYFREDAHNLHDAQVLEKKIQRQEDAIA